MTWDQSTAWWVATGLLVAMELTSGTFYLLMVAVGTASGAVAAHAGLGFPAQLILAAIVAGAAVSLWRRRRMLHPPAPRPAENPDINLDVGTRVQVSAWTADRQAKVNHRGAAWAARFAGRGEPAPGEYIIVAVEGLQLVLDHPRH